MTKNRDLLYRYIYLLVAFVLLGAAKTSAQQKSVYKDSTKTPEQRADDLLKRMTTGEKITQLQSQLLLLQDYENRDFSIGFFRNIADFIHGNGPVSAGGCAAAINEDTRKSIAASRFGIPVLQEGEALHGATWGITTVFPQSIGMAASFDDSLVYLGAQAIAEELRAAGVRQVYAPVINISRDPRWGRTQETYGEDVFLTSRMGVAFTKALQEDGVIATPKHFVDNYGAGGHDSYASETSWRTLREVYLEPFRACIQEGHAGSIMAAYNSVDGLPCSSSSVLLNDILRKEWGFKGFTVSDYGGIYGIFKSHKVAASYPEAQAQSLQAGLDVELPIGYRQLAELLQSRRITEKDIDIALRRVLIAKFALGLFEHSYVDTARANEVVRSLSHRQLALHAARETMTLLKNSRQTLPLIVNAVKRIGVFGPAANVLSLGDYTSQTGNWKVDGTVNPYQGLVNLLKGKAEVVLYKPGTDPAILAQTCDAVIYFAAIQEGEARDRSHLSLPAQQVEVAKSTANAIIVDNKTDSLASEDQEQMIRTLAATGKKTIVVLQNGSPIDISNWVPQADAILEAWYPGEAGGTAIAETLFGENDPGGRLPITWPRSVGQVPLYYSIKPSGRGYDYNDDDGKPLYPFGYGLSYTTFSYSGLSIPQNNQKGKDVAVNVTIKNTGTRKGDAVAELYLRALNSPVVRPLKELKAFRRVSLNPGESKTITLNLPARSFGYWDKDLKFVNGSGDFEVMISRDAENDELQGKIKINP